ncbi:MAG: carboxypeptidase-like regulatory domain-containing protein [Arachidicoccus sp.]|nr:carboxypeptidase-like regulatory domain-containing protein [Arachidicoccus sp.]
MIDFSTLSDDEIIKIVSQQKGNLCGRFQTDQLNKELIQSKQSQSSKGFYKYLAGILLLGISKNSFSNNNKILSKENIVANPIRDKNINRENLNDTLYKEIRGRVLDSATQKPFSYAFIRISGTQKGAITDSSGHFILKVPQNFSNQSINLIIGAVGYNNINDAISLDKFQQEYTYFLKPVENELMGDVIITNYHKQAKHWWQFWKRK